MINVLYVVLGMLILALLGLLVGYLITIGEPPKCRTCGSPVNGNLNCLVCGQKWTEV